MTTMHKAFERMLRAELRRFPRVDVGRVKAVKGETGEWQLATLENGKTMPVVGAPVAVDDVVYWLRGPKPVCLGAPAVVT